MSKPDFKQIKDNEGFEIPLDEPWVMKCCDCGLVHLFNFHYEDGKLGAAAVRWDELKEQGEE